MIRKYSKPSLDIMRESADRSNLDQELLIKQNKTQKYLEKTKLRNKCVLCNESVGSQSFVHRQIDYIQCINCYHIQTMYETPVGYPEIVNADDSFAVVYPKLKIQDYKDRVERIYQPKLNWIIDSLAELGVTENQIKSKKWLEFGCGAGYFINALKEYGVREFKGYDRSKELVELSNEVNGVSSCIHLKKDVNHIDTLPQAHIYVSFFVFEHLSNPFEFYSSLSKLPEGTILIFSVPVFGASCLFEQAFPNSFARNLDSVHHTQLYTDESIDYALQIANFTKVSEWIFGQDVSDLNRMLHSQLENNFINHPKLYHQMMVKFTDMSDFIQEKMDRLKLSDQRHIIAVKGKI